MSVFFILYLAVIFFEYFGVGRYVPLVNALSVTLLISSGLLVYVWLKGDMMTWLKEKQAVLLIAFLFFTMLSVSYAIVRINTINSIKAQVGYVALFMVSLYFVAGARRSRILAWLLVLVHTVLVFENSNKLFAARIGSYNAAYFMGDGNDFGWALNIVLPLAIYLFLSSRRFLARMVLFFVISILIVGITGTSSRGAALAMAAGFLYFILASDRKLISLTLISVVVTGVIIFAPSTYFGRLETIGTYTEDTSAMDRIHAWEAAFKMATDYPLGVGAGNFNAAYGRFYKSAEVSSPRWISPHSIYFLALGEYGFVGPILLLTIIFMNFKQNRHSIAYLRSINDPPIGPLWPMCINMSLVAFAVGGMFLGGVHYPHLYILTALTMGTKVMTGGFEKVR